MLNFCYLIGTARSRGAQITEKIEITMEIFQYVVYYKLYNIFCMCLNLLNSLIYMCLSNGCTSACSDLFNTLFVIGCYYINCTIGVLPLVILGTVFFFVTGWKVKTQ